MIDETTQHMLRELYAARDTLRAKAEATQHELLAMKLHAKADGMERAARIVRSMNTETFNAWYPRTSPPMRHARRRDDTGGLSAEQLV